MFSKTFLLIFLVIRLALIRSEDGFSHMTLLQPIQSDMFEIISTFANAAWNETSSINQNFHFFPTMESLTHYVELMRRFYLFYRERQDIFLERPRAFASILDKLENSSKVTLNFSQMIFFDANSVNEQYVVDMRTHFHVDSRPFFFDPANIPKMETALTEWISTVSNGLEQRKRYPRIRLDIGKPTLEYVTFCFKAQWHTTKNSIISIETSPDRPMAKLPPPTLDFHRLDQMIKANAIYGKEKIGYYMYNNVELNYEAIRIPFSNEEFAMAVVLPHYSYSLEVLKKFTEADYRKLFQGLKENRENVHYTIPFINSTALLINDIGVSINEDNFRDLVVVRGEPRDESGTTYKPFLVDRPFGVIIYHEKTSFVLLYALVRDPTSNWWPLGYVRAYTITSDGKEEDFYYFREIYKDEWYTRYSQI